MVNNGELADLVSVLFAFYPSSAGVQSVCWWFVASVLSRFVWSMREGFHKGLCIAPPETKLLSPKILAKE